MAQVSNTRIALGGIGALAATAIITTGDPAASVWVALSLSALYAAVELRSRRRPGPGWIVALGAAAAFGPTQAVLMVAVSLLVSGVPEVIRHWKRTIARIAAHVLPIVVFAVALAVLPESSTVAIATAGAVAGAVARTLAAALDWVTRGRASHPAAHHPLFVEILEAAALGLGAALLGEMVAEVGTLTLPAVIAALAILMAAESARREVHRARVGTVRSLLIALEAKDLYTRGHAERVARYARFAGKHMGLSAAQVDRLEVAALLHDVGKVVTPRHLLRKNGRLTGDEYCRIQHHADVVPEVLAGIGFLDSVVPIIAEHHIHFDGGGYGEASGPLSIEARILAVADSFDAMTTHRPYRAALSREYAFEELRRCSNTQFDPDVVEVFVAAMTASEILADADGFASDEEARNSAETQRAVRPAAAERVTEGQAIHAR